MKSASILIYVFMFISWCVYSQDNVNRNIFRQLTDELPTPNRYRTVTGRPGPDYFQQKVDYKMKITLNEDEKIVSGTGTITYHNNSPENLSYLWFQLDQNIREKDSYGSKIATSEMSESEHISRIMKMNNPFDGGFRIISISNAEGVNLETIKNHTVMKVLLYEPLDPGDSTTIKVDWYYRLNNMKENWGRSGYDPFEDGNHIYAIAQFYPRLCVFNDYGWQIKQFIGPEFALEFGDFDVFISVPDDHVVAATGELQNGNEVLSPVMLKRLEKARKSSSPLFIITENEARKNGKSKPVKNKIWHFKAKNVRDFAFASSRKFVWDAMNVKIGDNNVLAMSFYPPLSTPLWSKFSTKTIAHTLRVYSSYTFNYPYPVVQSIDASLGMEYPMISFNGGRPNADGSYSKGTRNSMIGVIRHEVGHNYIPMTVNTDERQWSWMDEGFNVFLQGLGERKWDINQYWSGIPTEMIGYMDDDKSTIAPIMTSADALLQSGMNSYRKPAVGLTILRETILGRELFDQAFREYTWTWMFKHPQPADFFRIMEDASGIDLDWFWRGWYFTTEHVDIGIEDVKLYIPVYDEETAREAAEYKINNTPEHIATIRDRELLESEIDLDKELRDVYNEPEPLVSETKLNSLELLKNKLTEEELKLLDKKNLYYEITFKSHGGMIMPLILKFEYKDGTSKEIRIPAEIWIKNQKEVTKVFIFDKEVNNIILDPYIETADINTRNNYWPRRTEKVYMDIRK
ncbi:MAG: M1 family metallopeptidase [Bacteroidota bacterium]